MKNIKDYKNLYRCPICDGIAFYIKHDMEIGDRVIIEDVYYPDMEVKSGDKVKCNNCKKVISRLIIENIEKNPKYRGDKNE